MVKKELIEKWEPYINDEIKFAGTSKLSGEKLAVTSQLLENTDLALQHGQIEKSYASQLIVEDGPTNQTGGVQNYDPVLINMIRRTAPNLVSFEIMGMQPMTGPNGTIFALRSRYANQTGTEAFYNEANTGHASVTSGNNEIVGDATLNLGTNAVSPNTEVYNFSGGMTTAQLEALGASGNTAFAEMGISIEKVTVDAKGRGLKAEYSHELAQDLKAIHGLEAEQELSGVLSTELIAEINREAVRTVFVTAKVGAQSSGLTTAGTFDLDTDSNGRWMGERFAGLHYQIARECNAVAKETRRGRGNILITSSDVAAALQMAGVLKYVEASANLTVDDTGVTYAGTINGNVKVYIDPYAAIDFAVIGYKGSNSWDAGLFYCPYTPLQMVRAVGENSLQPVIGFKTRYGMVANPFSKGATASDGSLEANSNVYYRKMAIANLV
jgi:hypothetical protein